jgi:hypothetical protein
MKQIGVSAGHATASSCFEGGLEGSYSDTLVYRICGLSNFF